MNEKEKREEVVLKLCPCCGSKAHTVYRHGISRGLKTKWYRERTECNDNVHCGLMTKEHVAPGASRRAWNRRKNDEL